MKDLKDLNDFIDFHFDSLEKPMKWLAGVAIFVLLVRILVSAIWSV
ncbi:MAG: hypothetical protein KGL39_34335 [Patescibacteria group bacterium]|nr:hypothetical protein [Patescibacteria group bacterium]